MTMRQVVGVLQSQGHQITYYQRRDGGILIKSIDGRTFSGASGNLYARALTGERLSTKRAKQLGDITWSGKRAESQISYKEIDVKKKLQRVQRKWNKAFRKSGMIDQVGRKTARKVKWSIEHRGVKETMRLLDEAERYATGKAYSRNIQHLVDFIKETAQKMKSKALEKLANDISLNAWKIKEDSIYPAYQKLYELNVGISPEDVANDVRRILEIDINI